MTDSHSGAGASPEAGSAQATLGRLLIGVDHVGFAVVDLDEAVALWTRLGLREVHRERNDAQGVIEAMMAAGSGTTQIQLLASSSESSPIAAWLERRGPGIQQVAFTVTDVRAAATSLRDAGFTVLYDEPRTGTHGSLINFVHPKSCGGVLVELVEHLS